MHTPEQVAHPHEHGQTRTRTQALDNRFIERIAEAMGDNARATTIFAAPVEADGITVIPVSRARWGFGGGTGRQKEGEEGVGGGGGMVVTPVGYIELRKGKAHYQPIARRMTLLPAVIVAGAMALLLIRRMFVVGYARSDTARVLGVIRV